MLEQGPAIYQQPVLSIICAILKYSDATAPGLKQFHGHLLRIITSHVKVSVVYFIINNKGQFSFVVYEHLLVFIVNV